MGQLLSNGINYSGGGGGGGATMLLNTIYSDTEKK